MNNEFLYNAITDIDDDLIEQASKQVKLVKKRWLKRVVLAAAACLAVILSIELFTLQNGKSSQTISYDTYFKDNVVDEEIQPSYSISDPPYDSSRDFSEYREDLTSNHIIPPMEAYPDFYAEGCYNEDGSIYEVILIWNDYSDGLNYKQIMVTAATEENHHIVRCPVTIFDENGQPIDKNVTETKRDGTIIYGKGLWDTEKSLTFYRENIGWIHIEGSYTNTFEDIGEVLEWIWNNGFDFNAFSKENGDDIVCVLDVCEALASYMPDYETLGYVAEQERYLTRNGVPYAADGEFIQAGQGSFFWSVDVKRESLWQEYDCGAIEDLTLEKVAQCFTDDVFLGFWKDEYFILIWTNTLSSEQIWELIETVK